MFQTHQLCVSKGQSGSGFRSSISFEGEFDVERISPIVIFSPLLDNLQTDSKQWSKPIMDLNSPKLTSKYVDLEKSMESVSPDFLISKLLISRIYNWSLRYVRILRRCLRRMKISKTFYFYVKIIFLTRYIQF